MSEPGWCGVHRVPLLYRYMRGGWTTVCPWCDLYGKYEDDDTERIDGLGPSDENTYETEQDYGAS